MGLSDGEDERNTDSDDSSLDYYESDDPLSEGEMDSQTPISHSKASGNHTKREEALKGSNAPIGHDSAKTGVW